MTTQKPVRVARALKARVVPTLPDGDPLKIDGDVLRLQGLVAAYRRNLKRTKTGYPRLVLQKALRRAQAELRLAQRYNRVLESV